LTELASEHIPFAHDDRSAVGIKFHHVRKYMVTTRVPVATAGDRRDSMAFLGVNSNGNRQPARSHVGRVRPTVLRVAGVRAIMLLVTLVVCVPGYMSAQTGAVTNIYDAVGRLVGVVDPNGASAVYTYDAVGNLLSVDRRDAGTVSIISFTPSSGPVGTTVTIAGTGFSSTPSQNVISFNGVAATVSAATSNVFDYRGPTRFDLY
jgi:YD repeat-containing protein